MKKFLSLAAIVLIVAACDKKPEPPKRAFVDVPGIDNSIKPGDNFFRFVNGKWYDSAQIDADQAGVGSYMFLNIPQKKKLQAILDSVSIAQNAPGSLGQQVGDFYASGMDTATINKRGIEPILPTLARIEAIKDVPSMMTFVAEEIKVGNRSIVEFGIWPDNKNSNINIAHVAQAGIGLPDREYYFKTDSGSVKIQEAYKTFLAALFRTRVDEATATKNADIVYNIEKQLAQSHKTNVQLRDVNANYNKVSIASIDKKQPNIGWSNLLKTIGAATDSLDMMQPAYFDKLNGALKSVPLDQWKVYLAGVTMNNYASTLTTELAKQQFQFVKVLTGQDKQKTRSQIITENVDNMLGDPLAQLYVKKYFNEDAKKRVLDLVNNLQKAFETRMNNLDWMSDTTKQKAKEKLYTITKKIGYPDKWRDFSNVSIDRGKYFENIAALRQNDFNFQLTKLNKPVDKSEWGATPPTVTAYYNPFYNEIVFPAGILQYPYFDFEADDAINYGGIGMVIGHELTHAFDDQGAQFDKDGNVKNWWTKGDLTRFKAKTQQVIDLYSSFTVLDTVHVKGALTVGENTADNGGVAIAYDAFKLTKQGQDTVKIDGYTPDQRFFLSVARIWRVKTRDAFLRNYVATNAHSPAMWRVNGPTMNFAPFYAAFNVQPGEKNYKAEAERIKIW